MRALTVQPLSREAFAKFGTYADLLRPTGEKLAPGVVEFYRDLLPLPLSAAPSASVTKIGPRPMTVEKWEYHTATGEAFMPLDGDVVACFAPAGRESEPSPGRAEAFLIPRGTMVAIRAGVWHQAPYAVGGQTVHNLVLLPERTYANDCVVVPAQEDARLTIEEQ